MTGASRNPHGLGRKLIVSLALAMLTASLVFLFVFIGAYQARLVKERGDASAQVNRLLQASLENAMLKRDLAGLRDIVSRLGAQERIDAVMILNPSGVVRFASRPEMLGRRFDVAENPLCPGCQLPPVTARTAFLTPEKGREVLRSVNPVRNKKPCTQCHGEIAYNPVNGVLVIDYNAAGIKGEALGGALLMGGSGLAVVVLTLAVVWFTLHRWVLRPVLQLTVASERLAAGDLMARAPVNGHDELSRLGETFNHMADRLEKSLHDLERREVFLQALIDAIPDGVRVIAPDYRVVLVNRAYCDQLGADSAQVLQQPCHVSSHRRNEPCPPTFVTCPLNELNGETRSLVFRERHVAADGRAVFVEVSAAPLEATSDGETFIVEVIRDLSQEMRVSQEQKLSEIGLLATGIAHEIRNPLASIRLSFRALQRKAMLEDNRDTRFYMDIVNTEIDKCIDVTDRLLKLSMPAGRPTLISLSEIVTDVMTLLEFEAVEGGFETSLDIGDDLRVVAADADMRMLVFNLVQNAFHAMRKGDRLTVEAYRKGKTVQLAITDTGAGIRPSDMSRIFDPFWSRRADGVRGTGLGLSICRAIVGRCKGKIDVESEFGSGSRFVVTLPLADREQVKEDERQTHPSGRG